MIGIIVSITLISGVNISTNLMARHMITESLDTVKLDFVVRSSDTSISANLARLNTLEDSIEEFQGAFAFYYYNAYSSLIQDGETGLNWSVLENYNDYIRGNNTHLCGFQDDIFTDSRFKNRFENTVRFNGTFDPTQTGIYLDSDTARLLGVQKGDNVSFGLFSDQWVQKSPEEYDTYHSEIANITIVDTYSILNRQELGEVFQGSYGYIGESDVVLFGNLNHLKNSIISPLENDLQDQIEADGGNYYPYESAIQYAVLVDHQALAVMDPNALQGQITQMQNRIQIAGEGKFLYVTSYLSQATQFIQLQLIAYQVLFIIVSVPVLILGWYLCKTNWLLSYQRRQREIALLKVKGGRSKQLKSMFFFEACIIGIFGGVFGIIGGDLTAVLVLQNIYPDALEAFTTNELILATISGEFLTRSTWILGIIGGLLISIFAVRKPLNDYAKRDAIEGLQKYHEVSRNELPRRKIDIAILIIGIIPLVLTFATDFFLQDNPYILYNPFIVLLFSLSTALLPIAPFTLTYGVIKLICSNLFVFRGLITRVSGIFSRSISVFASKSILRNQQRSFRLVFIVAMALSFMVMASTIKGTEIHYQEQINTLNTADGLRYNIYSPKFQTESEPFQLFMDYVWRNASDFHIEGMNWHIQLNQAGLKGSNENPYYYEQYQYIGVGVISATNFTEFIELSDSWFGDITAKAAMDGLTEGDTALIPQTMAESGYKIGDEIIIEYMTPSGVEDEITLEIIGIYKALPFVSSSYYQSQIIVDNATIPDGIFNYIDLSLYIEEEFELEMDPESITAFLQDFDVNGYVYYYDPSYYSTDITSSLLRFLNMESFYLLTIVSFGIGIIMYISVNEKAHDFGLLRARGVMKNVIYKIQLAEGSTLIFLGTLLSFPGILGAGAILLRLNTLSSQLGMIERTIYIPWMEVLGQFAIALGVFFISIIIAVALEIRKSNISKIGEILRVDA